MAIPMQATEEYQELYTRDHGTVKVDGISFQDGGYHVVKCPNGSYRHANGLPISSESELRAAIPAPFLQAALDWFRNRHEWEENPPRPISFDRDNYPIFEDGTPVEEFDDLYAYFKPGPVLTAAILALQKKKKAQEGAATAAKAQPAGAKKTGTGKKQAGKKTGKAVAKSPAPASPQDAAPTPV